MKKLQQLVLDTRLDHLPFTSPSSLILVLVGYVYFVKRCGASYMSKREPFALQTTIIIYNLIQIILNSALVLYVGFFFQIKLMTVSNESLLYNVGLALLVDL